MSTLLAFKFSRKKSRKVNTILGNRIVTILNRIVIKELLETTYINRHTILEIGAPSVAIAAKVL
jgi:hypothetical protein